MQLVHFRNITTCGSPNKINSETGKSDNAFQERRVQETKTGSFLSLLATSHFSQGFCVPNFFFPWLPFPFPLLPFDSLACSSMLAYSSRGQKTREPAKNIENKQSAEEQVHALPNRLVNSPSIFDLQKCVKGQGGRNGWGLSCCYRHVVQID